MTRVLAVDVGTSSVRAQIFDERVVERDAAKRDYAGETDADRLVEAARAAVDEARPGTVDAVGTSCFGHSLVAVSDRGRPLTPVLGWRDTRSADAAEWLSRRLDAAAVHARTGCHVHTSYWPAKLAWLASMEPELFRTSRRFVSFAEYLYGELLDEDDVPMSVSQASGTGLLNLHTFDWDDELLEALGVERARLPRIGDEEVAGWFPALLDGACSNVGAGCVSRERAALMVGTSGALRTVYETETPMPRPGLFLYRVDARRVVEGGALSDGGNLYHWLGRTLES
ncbi:MAG: carbohydrate kinase, partial [Acidobacteria bacterium]|nr:carbohydrate kinase [Acidobacteriota bacterium]